MRQPDPGNNLHTPAGGRRGMKAAPEPPPTRRRTAPTGRPSQAEAPTTALATSVPVESDLFMEVPR